MARPTEAKAAKVDATCHFMMTGRRWNLVCRRLGVWRRGRILRDDVDCLVLYQILAFSKEGTRRDLYLLLLLTGPCGVTGHGKEPPKSKQGPSPHQWVASSIASGMCLRYADSVHCRVVLPTLPVNYGKFDVQPLNSTGNISTTQDPRQTPGGSPGPKFSCRAPLVLVDIMEGADIKPPNHGGGNPCTWC